MTLQSRISPVGRLSLVACATLTAAAFAVPSSASAAVSCNLAGGVLTVEVTGTGDQIAALRMANGGTVIQVSDSLTYSTSVACVGGQPDQTNTNSIAITDTDPGLQRTVAKVSLENGPFINTDATGEGGGVQEIEVTVDGGDEVTDNLVLDGGPAGTDDNWRMGEVSGGEGYQLDDTEAAGVADIDDVVTVGVEQLQAGLSGSNPGNDILDARGGSGFTGPLTPGSVSVQMVGGTGGDQLFAGNGNGWFLDGGAGADTQIGGPGNDQLRLTSGTDADTGDGNGGTDSCSYQNHEASVQVDLRITGPQDTGGAGIDTLSDCESLVGSNNADTLIGTSGPNTISSLGGNDTLMGLGGNDVLTGGNDSDTASYAQGSTAAVTVNLATLVSQNTGGAGSDTITTMENLTGSEFSDTLTGDANPNTIDAYDGVLDTVDCAGGSDNAIADEVGVDTLTDCETIDNAPRVSVGPTPADGALLNDPTPAYSLTADEAATFEVSVDGGAFTACAASCEPPTLADGQHTLEFRAVDADENLHPGLDSESRTVTVDTVANVQITGGPTGATNDPTPSFTFASTDGSTFQCRVDGGAFGACSAANSHTPPALSDGAHTFEVQATDGVGNSLIASRAFTVDTVVPDLQIVDGPGAETEDTTPTFGFTAAGAETVECRVDGEAFAACSGPGSSHTTGPLPEGAHTFEVRGTDAAGNTAQATRAFTVVAPTNNPQPPDTAAPETTITKVKVRDDRATVRFTSSETGSTFACKLDKRTLRPCTSPARFKNLDEGRHKVKVFATDAAGNKDASAAKARFRVG